MTTESSLQYVEVNIIKTTMFYSNIIRFMYNNYDYVSNNDTISFIFNDGTIIDNTNTNTNTIDTNTKYKIEYYNLSFIYSFCVNNTKLKIKTIVNGLGNTRVQYKEYDKNSLFMSSFRACTYYNVITKKTAFEIDRLKDNDITNLKFLVAYDKDIFNKNDVINLTSKILKLL